MRALLGVLALALLVPAAPAAPGVVGAAGAAGAAAAVAPAGPDAVRAGHAAAAPASRALPALEVRRQVRGLDVPWDVQVIGRGRLLVTERDSARLLTWQGGRTRRVEFPSGRVWVSGETGLLSLAVDPQFATNRRIYTCSGWEKAGGGHDVRVIAWRLDEGVTHARRVETLVAGFPTSTGRHGGCRLLVTRQGALLVGTGDAAQGRNPRNLRSLGGKTLRLDRFTGDPHPDNPFAGADHRRKRYVFTYGHRNVQGLVQRPDGTLWSVEHGPDRDDEVNRLRAGGDYGWHPVPGYDESVPMTDHGLPGRQVDARWSSGSPTLATSGAAWVRGAAWGRLQGTLAVAALKASRVVFMKFDRAGRLKWTRAPRALRQFGRLRSVTLSPTHDLLVTTSNGGGRDAVLRVSPR